MLTAVTLGNGGCSVLRPGGDDGAEETIAETETPSEALTRDEQDDR
jgi:hypothetical protein